MSNSYEPFDRAYRRGLVLGLSLAEIFLILIFLLLLTSIGIATIQEKKKKDLSMKNELLISENKKLYAIKDELSNIEQYIGDNIEPTKLAELIKKAAANKKAVKENNQLKDKLKSLNEKLQEVEKVVASLDNEKNKLNKAIESLGKEKGDIPPCWFYFDKKDKLERHLKIFDVLLSDYSIIIQKNNHDWLGSRERDLGNIEVSNLIPNNFFGKKLSYSQFDKLFKVYQLIGDEKKIRSYQCRFMANVYDATSRDKVFWKNNLARVEYFFYKDVKKSTWPHR